MTITKLWHGDKNSPVDVQQLQKEETLDKATRTILRIGNIANNGRLADGSSGSSSNNTVLASTMGDETSSTKTRWLGQPTDVAIMDLLDLLGEHDIRENIGDRQQETAFSSEKKWMGVAIPAKSTDGSGGSAVGYIKGAIEQVLKRCDTYLTKDGREVVLDEANRKKARDAAESMAGEGLRVLAFASGSLVSSNKTTPRSRTGTPVNNKSTAGKGSKDEDLYQGLAFAGLVGMSDPPRKGVDKSIRKLMAGGVKVIMITGDAETTAVAISKKLGMPVNMNSAVGKAVIRGDELDRMSEEELSQAIATTTIFARTSPEHKMKIIRALQARGDVVAMTGDGVNDAPALKKADIGVAMGRLGTDVAKEAADMILTDDDFSTILSAIEEGKGIFSNIQNFLTFQLSTSAAALSLVLFSTFLGFQNPLNAMQILWISESLPYSPLPSRAYSLISHHRHLDGRAPRPIPRRRTRRPSRHETAPSSQKRPRADAPPVATRPAIRVRHHARHPPHLHPRNVHGRRGHGARHDNDIHMLCALRHVQRPDVPLAEQERAERRSRALLEQDVQLCRRRQSGRAGRRRVSARGAEDLSDRGARVRGRAEVAVYCEYGLLG